MHDIVPVRTPDELRSAIALFRAYAASLDIDLAYQGFEAEMAAMPGQYAPPTGEVLLAQGREGKWLGCVGLRPLPMPGICEMKRLYVCPAGRGRGVGQALIVDIIAVAERIGFREMRLDSLPSMAAALRLYRAAGFELIPAYYETPVPGTLFLGRGVGGK
jgi:ribosomal protein S18 acetylase RimI-like enzyme